MRSLIIAVLMAALMTIPATAEAGYRWKVVKPYNAKLERMARCESGGRWYINTGNGFYGGLQFTFSTWRSVGGRGYPHHNSRLEQKYRAVKLIKRAGYGPWPICGFR